jgi:hypothetical protein
LRIESSKFRFKVSNDADGVRIEHDHPHKFLGGPALLANALGSVDQEFIDGILRQLANASSNGKGVDERELNFLLSVINGIEPRDQVETMLAAQMALVHVASMTFAGQLTKVKSIPELDSTERACNKLARTFAAQRRKRWPKPSSKQRPRRRRSGKPKSAGNPDQKLLRPPLSQMQKPRRISPIPTAAS